MSFKESVHSFAAEIRLSEPRHILAMDHGIRQAKHFTAFQPLQINHLKGVKGYF